MNVKANMLIANLPEVQSFYVMPSAADGSLSIGACLHSFYNNNSDKDHTESVFNNLYFGTEFTKQQEQKAVEKIAAGNPIWKLMNQMISKRKQQHCWPMAK